MRGGGLFHCLLPVLFSRGGEGGIVNLDPYSLHYHLIPKWAPLVVNQIRIQYINTCIVLQADTQTEIISRYNTQLVDEVCLVRYRLTNTLLGTRKEKSDELA